MCRQNKGIRSDDDANTKVATVCWAREGRKGLRSVGGGGGGVAGTSAATCQRPLSKAFGKVNMFPAVCAIVPKHVGDDVSTYFWH